MPTVLVERPTRGFGGHVCLVLFWTWQALMIVWLLSFTVEISKDIDASVGQPYGEATTGAALGFWGVLFVWAAGSVITGALTFFTRGERQRVQVEPREDPPGPAP